MSRGRLFVDTSAWLAYVNAADADHRRVRAILDDPPGRLVTSTYVFDENVTLTQARLGHRRAIAVGRALLDPGLVELLHVAPPDEKAAWPTRRRRGRSSNSDWTKSYSFTDCTSFVVMRREHIEGAIALDAHFSQEGFTILPR